MSVKLSFTAMSQKLKGRDIGNLREKLKNAGEKVPTNRMAKEVLARALSNKSEKQRDEYLRKGLGLRYDERKKIEKKFFGQGEKTLHEKKIEKKEITRREKLNIYLGKRSAKETEEYKKQKGGWYKSDGNNRGLAGQAAGNGSNTGFAGPGQAPQTGQDDKTAGAPGRAKFQTIGGAGNPPAGDDKNIPPEPPNAPPITLLPI